jgi:hypothetical protein
MEDPHRVLSEELAEEDLDNLTKTSKNDERRQTKKPLITKVSKWSSANGQKCCCIGEFITLWAI